MSLTDSLIVGLATLLVAGLYGLLWQPTAGGTDVSVWVMGEERHRYALGEDRIEHIPGALGDSVIEIRDGRVRVLDSPGAQQICQRVGWLQQAGDSAICLPNEVVVQVEGGAPRYDSMNF